MALRRMEVIPLRWASPRLCTGLRENVTGFTTFNDTLAAKRFEMLKEILPAMRKAALMWNPANPQQELQEKYTVKAEDTYGIELLSLPIRSELYHRLSGYRSESHIGFAAPPP